VNENVWITSATDAGSVAFATVPNPATNVMRLGDVILSANGATTFTLTVGTYVQKVYLPSADTVILPRGICGNGGPGSIASSGSSVSWSVTIPWNYDIPFLHP